MKLRNLLFPFLFLGFLGTIQLAQAQGSVLNPDGDKLPADTARSRSEQVLMDLLELAQEKEYYKISKMMVYSGPDQTRDLVSMMDFYSPYDRLEVENTANLLRHWLDKSTIHINKNFRTVPGWKHDLYIWDVEFTNQRGKTKVRKFIFTYHNSNKIVFVRADKY